MKYSRCLPAVVSVFNDEMRSVCFIEWFNHPVEAIVTGLKSFIMLFLLPIFMPVFFMTLFLVTVSVAGYEDRPVLQECNAQYIRAQQKNAPSYLIRESTAQREYLLGARQNVPPQPVKQYGYKVIYRLPHAKYAFTQGLVFYNNYLYEGTGLLGQSEIRKLDIKTGEILKAKKTNRDIFGEGISIINNQLLQLSWKAERAYIYDLQTFNLLGSLKYKGEGWGIAVIDNNILISDGSSVLKWLNINNQNKKDVRVNESGIEIQGINELEYVNGQIYANIWPTDCIAQIDLVTGNITAWIDLTDLYPVELRPDGVSVLNGIAHQYDENYFFVTGKYWPYIYVIELLLSDETALQ